MARNVNDIFYLLFAKYVRRKLRTLLGPDPKLNPKIAHIIVRHRIFEALDDAYSRQSLNSPVTSIDGYTIRWCPDNDLPEDFAVQFEDGHVVRYTLSGLE